MSEDLKRIQQRARDLARSGKFIGSRAVAFELQFEPGYAQAFPFPSLVPPNGPEEAPQQGYPLLGAMLRGEPCLEGY